MFEKFTEKSIKVLTAAQDEANASKHKKLYPEHILLGILVANTGITARFLRASGLSVEVLREKINQIIAPRDTEAAIIDVIQFSPAVRRILKEVSDKAKGTGANYINPEHIFLAILNDESTGITAFLKDFDVDVERIRLSISKIVEKKSDAAIHPENKPKTDDIEEKSFDAITAFEEADMADLMSRAQNKLAESRHEILGTEQILLAMLEQPDSSLSNLLQNAGVNYQNFVEKLCCIHSRESEYDKISYLYTPSALKALHSAYELSKELGAPKMKPEHVLLGLLKEKKGVAFDILGQMGVDAEELSEKILQPIEKQKPVTLTVIRLAKEEARRLSYNYVGTEMILLGLLGEGTGIAASVLKDLGVTLKDARIETEKVVGSASIQNKDVVFTPRAKKILELAWDKAKSLNCKCIETEHLLLAITEEKECLAMNVLSNLGVDAIEIRQGVITHMKNKKREVLSDVD